MKTNVKERRSSAEEELHRRRDDIHAAKTVASLCDGLDLLADLFFNRVDRDVEQHVGIDSMLMPPSTMGEIRASSRARALIDVYSSVVAAEEAVGRRYIDDGTWFIDWLLKLRVDDPHESSVQQRVEQYRAMQPDQRRLKFASSLERRMPHAMSAPLIIHRLYPLGVCIAVAIAFGDNLRAGELRNQQTSLLPVITDCDQCHGRPLDNGERCPHCSNPLWSYAWLTASD